MNRLLLVNGRIRSFDPQWPDQTALLCENGRVSFLGDDFDARALYRQGDEVIDLEGKSVLPAFHDAHTHFYHFAITLRRLRLEDAHSEHTALEAVRGLAERAAPGEWIVGRGWSLQRWQTTEWPTRGQLDEVAPNHPVALAAKDGHTWWVNSVALQQAGISRATTDPKGGVIERDASGEPTGILREQAIELIKPHIASPPERTVLGGLRDATDQFHTLGIASADILSGSMGKDLELEEAFRLLQKQDRAGMLGVRLTLWFAAQDLDRLIGLGLRSGFGGDWLRFGGIKLYADGSLGSGTAAMLEPYVGSASKGMEVLTAPEMAAIVKKAAENGIACAIHAIGDRAVRNALDAFEGAKAATAANGLRQRIEHAQCISEQDIPRFGQLGVIASVQPCQLMGDVETAERLWGPERSKRTFPLMSLLKAGAALAFGTDVPVEPPDPRRSLKGAVLRPKDDGSPWTPGECIAPWDAFLAYTRGSAWAAGLDHLQGSIAPGRRADLVVFNEDPIDCGPARMADALVVLTIVDGKVVYRKR
ncbi:MAG: amidohydrolase [Candidatus Brocadiae bacterium]|nr:amidohydrolase [Candidatus Brocadiia bacterium]